MYFITKQIEVSTSECDATNPEGEVNSYATPVVKLIRKK